MGSMGTICTVLGIIFLEIFVTYHRKSFIGFGFAL